MNRGHNAFDRQAGPWRSIYYFPSVLHQLELRPHDRLRRRRAETDENLRLHGAQLGLEPGSARLDFRDARLLVDAPLAARLPFEMLDGVGDVDVAARDAGALERLVEHRARGTDKRRALAIFPVA